MMKVAALILNRNLGRQTDSLCKYLSNDSGNMLDIYVIDAGSDMDKMSEYTSYRACWQEALDKGLRFNRGMNYGLMCLNKDNLLDKYDFILMMTNDTIINTTGLVDVMGKILSAHRHLGILAPCGLEWGEKYLIGERQVKYFWYIHNSIYAMRTAMIKDVGCLDGDHLNFLFDGANFRGYGTEHELIAKCYTNDWAAAITTEAFVSENESFLLEKADLIRTEPYSQNMKLYLDEGLSWMRKKYGFRSHWDLQRYAKNAYDMFFDSYPELLIYRL